MKAITVKDSDNILSSVAGGRSGQAALSTPTPAILAA